VERRLPHADAAARRARLKRHLAAARPARHRVLVSEQLVERDEVVALLFNVSDIVVTLNRILMLLEADDGEEEVDE
jgi:hypothetical protein